MRHTWRWFGPKDAVRIEDALQAGAQGIVTALHHIAPGEVWTPEEIAKRQAEVARRSDGAPSDLTWEVVESLPVSEDIRRQTGDWRAHIAAYKTSLHNLAAAGLQVICYNFMPVIDWTRTDLYWRTPTGATAMRFDLHDFAAFDIHVLARPGAARDFAPEVVEEAGRRFAAMDAAGAGALAASVMCGLPGDAEVLDLARVRDHLARYDAIDADRLRGHFIDFLTEVAPVAQALGLRLCCHPDDPPFPLLGLPRIMSTGADYARILNAVDLPANGMTFCSGSLGARPDNDLQAIMRDLGPRVHFLHLRNTRRDAGQGDAPAGSFIEAAHLEGDADMVALIAAILREEVRRKAEGRADAQIPMRPDHGQHIAFDLTQAVQPGYPLIGRLRGLAELRGVEAALSARL